MRKRHETIFIACCLECNGKLTDTGEKETKYCDNPKCSKYKVWVDNWYNFEQE